MMVDITDLSINEIGAVGGGAWYHCEPRTLYECDDAGNCTSKTVLVCHQH